MATKIKGWVDQFSVPPHQREPNENITVQDHKWLSGDLKCTLVVSDERVFTESEVKAMLVNITHECGCYEHRGEPVFATRVDDINHIAARHGVVLDPA